MFHRIGSALILLALGSAESIKEETTFLQSVDSFANTSPWLRGLFMEIEKFLSGGGVTASDRFNAMEKAMAVTFAAMPKNEHGRLDRTGVRYAMHRFFVHRHGWFVKGLEPNGGSFASTPAPTDSNLTSLQLDLEAAERTWPPAMPQSVADIFEERLRARGFSLFELSALAATLETLVHGEATGKLRFAYRANNVNTKDMVSIDTADTVIDTYMAAYILGKDLEHMNRVQALRLHSNIDELYPNWKETRQFLRDMRVEALGKLQELTFANLVQIVDTISAQYGRWQDRECQDLKYQLIKAGDGGTGCVPLKKFYQSHVHGGAYQFSESPEYLRQLGALDETNPANPQVIVPNYINSQSNCLASSKYYSVCCIDECEEILGRFERSLRSPEATPSEIKALATTEANDGVWSGSLPVKLFDRLNDIAQKHRGLVPLHGRLFAQWMHHAFPRECPYPHLAGTVNPLRPETYGDESIVSESELLVLSATEPPLMGATEAPPSAATEIRRGECTAWLDEEELFVHGRSGPGEDEMWAAATGMALLTAVASAMLAGARACLLAGKAVRRTSGKQLVAV